MQVIKKMDWRHLKHEYGVDGERLLPWAGASFPFGGAWCVVRAGTQSLHHINDPKDEDELFIAISGSALVWVGERSYRAEKGDVIYIAAGSPHYVTNDTEEEFHFYTIWWNSELLETSMNSRARIEE